MKKIVAFTLALVMMLSLLAGCGSSNGTAGDGKYKIGVILYGKEDTLGGRIYSLLNSAAAALDCEITFSLGDFDTTAQITAAENLISAGVDGIICLPLAETTSQKLSQLCQKNEVYFGLLLRTINDEEISKEVHANPYFVGNILGDDMGNAKELTRILIQEYGCKNLCTYYAPEGTSQALRNDGIREAIAEFGGKQLSEATTPSDSNMAPVAGVMQNFVNTNADFQGIVSAAGSSGIGETIDAAVHECAGRQVCLLRYLRRYGGFLQERLSGSCLRRSGSRVYLSVLHALQCHGRPSADPERRGAADDLYVHPLRRRGTGFPGLYRQPRCGSVFRG